MRLRRFMTALAIGVLASVSAEALPKAKTAASPTPQAPGSQYEVLSPWADVDPIPLRGISPRLQSLSGKKIGLFANFKRAARPMAASIEKRLRTMYPGLQTSLFDSRLPNVTETETKNRDAFVSWIKEVDGVVLMVGD